MGSCLSPNGPKLQPDDFTLPSSITSHGRHKDQLLDILSHAQLSILFQAYLKTIFCDESLAFFMDVEDFRSLSDEEHMKEKSTYIFEKYFTPNSKSEINIGTEMMNRMKGACANPSRDIFDRLQNQALLTMVEDCLPNFLTWQLYLDFISDPMTRKVFLCGVRRTPSVRQIIAYTEKKPSSF